MIRVIDCSGLPSKSVKLFFVLELYYYFILLFFVLARDSNELESAG